MREGNRDSFLKNSEGNTNRNTNHNTTQATANLLFIPPQADGAMSPPPPTASPGPRPEVSAAPPAPERLRVVCLLIALHLSRSTARCHRQRERHTLALFSPWAPRLCKHASLLRVLLTKPWRPRRARAAREAALESRVAPSQGEALRDPRPSLAGAALSLAGFPGGFLGRCRGCNFLRWTEATPHAGGLFCVNDGKTEPSAAWEQEAPGAASGLGAPCSPGRPPSDGAGRCRVVRRRGVMMTCPPLSQPLPADCSACSHTCAQKAHATCTHSACP